MFKRKKKLYTIKAILSTSINIHKIIATSVENAFDKAFKMYQLSIGETITLEII